MGSSKLQQLKGDGGAFKSAAAESQPLHRLGRQGAPAPLPQHAEAAEAHAEQTVL